MKCIEMILFSKAEVFQRLGVNGIDACGTPSEIIFDNGPEGKGERMELAAESLRLPAQTGRRQRAHNISTR